MSEPLTVLFVVPSLDVGGAETHLVSLVTSMDRERFAPVVVCLGDEGPLFPVLRASAVRAHALRRRKRAALLGAVDLWRIVRRERPGLVVTRAYNAEVLGRVVGLARGIPVCVWVHEVGSIVPRTRTRRLLDRVLNPRSAGVLAHVEAQRPHLRQLHWRDDQVHLVPPGVAPPAPRRDRSEVRAELGLHPEAELVVIVARMRPEKDHATLLRAFAVVAAARSAARLLMVGDGPTQPQLEDLAERLGVADRVLFAGLRADVADLVAAADVATLASRTECAPRSVLEAMALGTPVVATAVGGVPELVEHGITGELVEPEAPDQLGRALTDLLGDPGRRSTMADAARRAVARRFDDAVAVRTAERRFVQLARPPGRLTLVLHGVGRGGAEVSLLNLVRALDPSRVTVRMISLQRGGELAAAFREAGCPVDVVEGRARDPRTLLTVARRLRREADVVLVVSHHPEAMLLARVAARLTGTPDVVTVHTMGPNPPGGRCLARHTVETLRASRALVLLAPSQGDYLRQHEGVGSRWWRSVSEYTIPNGVPPAEDEDAAQVRLDLGFGADDVVVGCVGRLVPEKDHQTLVRAFARLAVHQPRARLLLVGGGPEESLLRELVTTLDLHDRVVMTGPRPDARRLLAAADVFALPSRVEAAPLVVLEAIHAALPVVATDCGALADLVHDGKHGYVVPVGDEEALADRITVLLDDPVLRVELGGLARDRAEFSDRVMADRFERLVARLCGRAVEEPSAPPGPGIDATARSRADAVPAPRGTSASSLTVR